jgi:hypothetical protein
MRKVLSIFVVLTLVLGSFALAFGQVAVPGDVSGTTYQDAVTDLMEKGVISGYPDGTYRPEGTITRAEACLIVVKSMNPPAAAITDATQSSFTDLVGYDWAKPYINYAAANDVISGYPDGTFRPGDFVTYNELAAMLVRALGFQAADLPGVWPANFVNKAIALGIFAGVDADRNDSATRGNVALMTFRVVDAIRTANLPEPPATPSEPTYADLAGPLATYSGRAYGIILDVAKVLDADGDVVDQIEFLFGNKVLYLNTNGRIDLDTTLSSDNIEDHWQAGDIFMLTMSNGVVRGVSDSDADETSFVDGFDLTIDFSPVGGWATVTATGDGVVEVGEDEVGFGFSPLRTVASLDSTFTAILRNQWISYLDSASIYLAVMDGNDITEYKVGTARDIKVGSYVRMYSVTGDEPGVGEIILVAPERPYGLK